MLFTLRQLSITRLSTKYKLKQLDSVKITSSSCTFVLPRLARHIPLSSKGTVFCPNL